MLEIREKNNWSGLAPVRVPTPVLALACDATNLWVGGVGGVAWSSGNSAWQASGIGLPLTGIAALASSDGLLLAGGSEGVACSQDGGRTWQQSALQEGLASVTALILSPQFEQDSTALVATLESGILRSTDRGRTWQSASFGLSCFEVSALLWAREQTVLAATPEGLFRSTNAGRAWKRVAACADTPIAALVSLLDGTLLAASEYGVLLISRDQGLHWEDLCTSPAYAQPTTLGVTSEGAILLGTAERGLLRIADKDAHWEMVLPHVPFTLAARGEELYAGTDAGLFISRDSGQTWRLLPQPPVHDLQHLLALPDRLLLAGPQSGLVRLLAHGSWQPLARPTSPLTAVMATVNDLLFVSNEEGLQRSADGGENWEKVLEGQRGQMTHLSFRADGSGWAVGTHGAHLWRTRDEGRSWQELPAPFGVLPVAALMAGDNLLLAATRDPRLNLVHIWLSQDEGESWTHGLEAMTAWPTVAVNQEPLAFSVGGTVGFRQEDGTWQQTIVGTVSEAGGFVRRLLVFQGTLLALTTTGLFHARPDGQTWRHLPLEEDFAELLDLVVVNEQIYGLFAGGKVMLLADILAQAKKGA